MTAKEEEDDPQTITILQREGQREVKGLKVVNLDILKTLKT